MALLVWGVFFFSPSPPRPVAKGPKVQFRVLEGAIEVFALRNDRIQSFLGIVKPGETLTAAPVPSTAAKIPLGLQWVGPVLVEGLQRTLFTLAKEAEKAETDEFTVTYPNEKLRQNFIRQFEQSRLLSGAEVAFEEGGFTTYARVGGISVSSKGTIKAIESDEGKLFLRLEWLKVGSMNMPGELLRSVEDLFEKSYDQAGNFPVKILRIVFGPTDVTVTLRKKNAGASDPGGTGLAQTPAAF